MKYFVLITLLAFPGAFAQALFNDLPVVNLPDNQLQPRPHFIHSDMHRIHQQGVDVNVSNLMGNEAEVSIDVNPTNPDNKVIVGHAPDLQTMNTFYTTDGGQTWTLVSLGPAQDGLPVGTRFDPTVAFAEDGNVYVAYGVIGGGTRTLVVARSTDGGVNYGLFTVISTDLTLDKWIINTGPDPILPNQSNVYLAYRIGPAGNVDVRLASSYDQGVTFPVDRLINDAGTLNTFGMPAVGPNGEVYVVWDNQTNAPASSSIMVDLSLDGGNTFNALGADVLVSTSAVARFNPIRYNIPAQPDRGVLAVPSIAADRSGGQFNGRVYVAYTDVGAGGFNDTDVMLRFSDDQGLNWSAPTLVNDDGGANSQFLPWLDVDQTSGQVVTTWYDARNDQNNQLVETFIGFSADGGVSFQPNILVSDGQSNQSVSNPNRAPGNFLEYIGVSSLNCMASAVWSDNSLDPADLDFFTDQGLIDITPPVITCPTAITVDNDPGQCDAVVNFTVTATDNCPGVSIVCLPPSGSTFPVGTTQVNCTATDLAGNQANCSFDVTVEDVEAPVITTILDPIELWPPNHKYVTIDVIQCVTDVFDNCASLTADDVIITEATSDEPEDAIGNGDGNTLNDIVISPDCGSVDLRSERAGGGNGRVYTIHLFVDDGNGNTSTATCKVVVPHSQNGDPAVDDGPVYLVAGSCGSGLSSFARFSTKPIIEESQVLPNGYELMQNYPNPFNPTTSIRYGVSDETWVTLKIFNMLGQEIITLVDDFHSAGYKMVIWDGRNSFGEPVSSGTYIYRMTAGKYDQIRMMMLLR
jgi:hypothetical protein